MFGRLCITGFVFLSKGELNFGKPCEKHSQLRGKGKVSETLIDWEQWRCIKTGAHVGSVQIFGKAIFLKFQHEGPRVRFYIKRKVMKI